MANSRITVRVSGAEHVFEMERTGRVILDVAARRGIELPIQCHVGWCLECRCRLVAGDVDMSPQVALDADQRAAGVILACCARPRSDAVILDFDSVG